MTSPASSNTALPRMAELQRYLSPYQRSDTRRAIRQLVNTLIPYLVMWVLMVLSLQVSYWLTFLLAVPSAALLIRIFIFFHDCGHNSFFPSVRANKIVGFWLGVLTFTPGEQWWHSHAIHHATSGNLDKRGVGDVETLTAAEYLALPPLRRLGYRLFRNPLVMFGLGPIYMFIIMHRLPIPRYSKKETLSVLYTNLALAAIITIMSLTIGFRAYVLIQLPVIWLAGLMGIWLFYIQHQYKDVYWAHTSDWDYVSSALRGASYYKLPRILEWVSGSIGYHQIHHLSPRIPNYNLRTCYEQTPLIQQNSYVIPFLSGIKSIGLKLWDEKRNQMIGFRELKTQAG